MRGYSRAISGVASRLAVGLVTAWAVVATWGVLLTYAAGPGDMGPEKLANWVDHHVRELQPSREERRIDEIGWAKTIVEAEQLAQEHNRPIFLFTYDGRIDTGRC
jgi:hypothetical protein